MRVLIYEPLPDMNRAPIIAQLAKTLMADGHDVLVVIEEKLIYTLLGKLTHQGVINCSRTWRRHIGIHKEINVYKLKTPWNLYWLVNERNLSDRLQDVAKLRRQQYRKLLDDFAPDRIFVWNGQHEHLQDFMSTAKQTHEGRFIYMECGWFPQKGTIYFDTEGVNAASSIAKDAHAALTDLQKTEINAWRQNYLTQPLDDTETNHVFVPLQVETDTNITIHSTYDTMQEFVQFLENWIPLSMTVTIRSHPLDNRREPITTCRSNFTIDNKTPLGALIDKAEFVIGINSTVLLEAIVRGKKVIALGNGYLPKTADVVCFEHAIVNSFNDCSSLVYQLVKRQCEIEYMSLNKYLNDNLPTESTKYTSNTAASYANAGTTSLHKIFFS